MNGRISGEELILTREGTEFSFDNFKSPTEVKPDSFVFYQARLAAKELGIHSPKGVENYSSASNLFLETFIDVSFENVVTSNSSFRAINRIKRIVLNFGNENIVFVPFLKSNSMSKFSKLYYINEKYEAEITKRVTFNLLKEDDSKVLLSKWYAYSGLSLSQVRILENVELSSDEVVVVDDYKVTRCFDAITAISVPSIIDEVRSFIKLSNGIDENDERERGYVLDKWNSYLASEDCAALEESGLKGAEDMKKALDLLNDILADNDGLSHKELSVLLEHVFLNDEIVKGYDIEKAAKVKAVPWFKFRVKKYPHEINAFDGEGLISEEFAETLNEELGLDKDACHSFQIRLPFIKGVVHACNLKDFFDDNGVEEILGIVNFRGPNDKKYKTFDVDKIKIILTESQVKFAAFAMNFQCKPNESQWDCYMRLLKEYEYRLGINNTEPDQSRDALLNYQFLSTMPLNDSDYKHILEYAKDNFVEDLKDESVAEYLDDNTRALYDANPSLFKSTSHFKGAKKDIFGSNKKDALLLRFPLESRRKFLSGDLFVLLSSIIGETTSECDRLAINQCYLPNDKLGTSRRFITLLRNPHYSRNEIAVLTPVQGKNNRDKYFSKLTGVVWVNPMSCVPERLGGADHDGDTVVAIYDKKISNRLHDKLVKDPRNDGTEEGSRPHMNYPLVLIPGLKGGLKINNHFNRMTCLRNTFSSRVGVISNDAVRFAEYAYESKDVKLHDYVGYYCILGGLEIDAAKSGSRPLFPKISELLGRSVKDEIGSRSMSKYVELKDEIEKDQYFNSTIAQSKFDDEEVEDTKFDTKVKEFLKSKSQTCFNVMVEDAMKWKAPGDNTPDAEWAIPDGDKDRAIAFFEAALVHKTITGLLNGRSKYLQSNNQTVSKIKAFIRGSGRDGYSDSDMSIFFNGISTNDANEAVADYFNAENKFHYMTDYDEKGTFIDEIGFASETSKAFYRDFENGGFKNFYLSLLYQKYKNIYDGLITFHPYECLSKQDFLQKYKLSWLKKGFIDLLSYDELSSVLDRANKKVVEVEDELKGGHRNISFMRSYLDSKIKESYGEFSMATMNMVLDAKNNPLVSRVYNSEYKQFLENAKKEVK